MEAEQSSRDSMHGVCNLFTDPEMAELGSLLSGVQQGGKPLHSHSSHTKHNAMGGFTALSITGEAWVTPWHNHDAHPKPSTADCG